MKRIAVAVLMLVVCAAPAFARHRKPHKDPRIVAHPKAFHPLFQHLKQVPLNKLLKHKTGH